MTTTELQPIDQTDKIAAQSLVNFVVQPWVMNRLRSELSELGRVGPYGCVFGPNVFSKDQMSIGWQISDHSVLRAYLSDTISEWDLFCLQAENRLTKPQNNPLTGNNS